MLAVAAGLLVASFLMLEQWGETTRVAEERETSVRPPPVTIIEVAVGHHRAQVSTLAELEPRYKTDIKALVRGQIVELNRAMLAGARVNTGDVLLRIDPASYLTAVADAENRRRQAEVGLLAAQREATLAKKDRERADSPPPDSPLALYRPQIEAAKAELHAAQAAFHEANTQLALTEIVAPYDGVIVSRAANPGEAIETGQHLATIMSAGVLDVAARLDERQWRLLPENWRGSKATLIDVVSGEIAPARVSRDAGFIDRQTRQRTLYLTASPSEADSDWLLPGRFVQIVLSGRVFENTLAIPESAWSRDGYIWHVDDDNRLRRTRVDPLFVHLGNVYVPAPGENIRSLRVALTPLASFLPGALVTPVERH